MKYAIKSDAGYLIDPDGSSYSASVYDAVLFGDESEAQAVIDKADGTLPKEYIAHIKFEEVTDNASE